MASLTPQEVRQILAALESSGWDEAVVTVGDVTISVSRDGAAGSARLDATPVSSGVAGSPETGTTLGPGLQHPRRPAEAPGLLAAGEAAPSGAGPSFAPAPGLVPGAAPAGSSQAGDVEVRSPTVGMFWRSPQPGAPPFVEVGHAVQPGDILCIVEVMKLMNNVVADVAGTVSAILVGNGGTVEHGQVIMAITPAVS